MTIRIYRPKLIAAVAVLLLSLGTGTSTQAPYTYTVIAPLGAGATAWAPSINNSGHIAFITGGTVYRGDGGALTTIYSYGPEQPPPQGHAPINAAGVVVFGAYAPGLGMWIVAGDGAAPATVLAEAGATWDSVQSPSINDAGQVVFAGHAIATGGYYIVMANAAEPIASPGDAVPGGTLLATFGPKINNIGDVAFTANVSAGPQSIFRRRAADVTFMGPASAGGELTFGMNDAGIVAFWRSQFPEPAS